MRIKIPQLSGLRREVNRIASLTPDFAGAFTAYSKLGVFVNFIF